MTTNSEFDCSGLASLSGLSTEENVQLFRELEAAQMEFLEKDYLFRSVDYKWPKDALHWWSRCWEYPYVLHHLRKFLNKASRPVVVDLGSGVTFFPFVVAREGFDVVCVDIDLVVKEDLSKAVDVIPSLPGTLTFRTTNGLTLPFEDESVDTLYCISVIEHIPEPVCTLEEIHRVLKPGGHFIVTVDIDLAGNFSLSPDEFKNFTKNMNRLFNIEAPEKTVHPRLVLDTLNSPYPLVKPKSFWARACDLIHNVLTFRYQEIKRSKLHLACAGYVMTKKVTK